MYMICIYYDSNCRHIGYMHTEYVHLDNAHIMYMCYVYVHIYEQPHLFTEKESRLQGTVF